jgi:hypothetical protein
MGGDVDIPAGTALASAAFLRALDDLGRARRDEILSQKRQPDPGAPGLLSLPSGRWSKHMLCDTASAGFPYRKPGRTPPGAFQIRRIRTQG